MQKDNSWRTEGVSELVSSETKPLREGIRSGMIDCPPHGGCNRMMAEHNAFCPWQCAIEKIYAVERELEGIK